MLPRLSDMACNSRYSLNADDVWLKVMQVIGHVPVVAATANQIIRQIFLLLRHRHGIALHTFQTHKRKHSATPIPRQAVMMSFLRIHLHTLLCTMLLKKPSPFLSEMMPLTNSSDSNWLRAGGIPSTPLPVNHIFLIASSYAFCASSSSAFAFSKFRSADSRLAVAIASFCLDWRNASDACCDLIPA